MSRYSGLKARTRPAAKYKARRKEEKLKSLKEIIADHSTKEGRTPILLTNVFKRFNDAFIDKGKYDAYVFEGGSRSSKTSSIIQFLILWAFNNQKKSNRVLISRKKGTWITSTVLFDFVKFLKMYGLYQNKEICSHKKNEGQGVITLFTTEFWFLGLDDPQRAHGLETDIFWLNEAMEIDFDDYAQLKQRCLGFAIIDYNPSFEEHWIYEKINKRKKTFFCHSTFKDNRLINSNVLAQIKGYEPTEENYKQGTADVQKWKIYGLGQKAQIEGLIFDKGYTLVKEIPMHIKKRFIGMDFGFSNDPTAIIEVGISADGKEVYLNELGYSTGMLSKHIAKIFKKHYALRNKKYLCYADCQDSRLIAELDGLGVVVDKVKKNEIVIGLEKMKELKIFITESSLNVINEFKNYTWIKKKGSNKFTNIPIDDFNHAIDAIRYVVIMEMLGNYFDVEKNKKAVTADTVNSKNHSDALRRLL